MVGPKAHWEQVYSTREPHEVGWFQAYPELPLRLIAATGVAKSEAIIDVGGGASNLVDVLLENGYRNVTVLDLSAAALESAQARLGAASSQVTWLVADVTRFVPSAAIRALARPCRFPFPHRCRRPPALYRGSPRRPASRRPSDHGHLRAGWPAPVQRPGRGALQPGIPAAGNRRRFYS